jgi:hypothetical protein
MKAQARSIRLFAAAAIVSMTWPAGAVAAPSAAFAATGVLQATASDDFTGRAETSYVLETSGGDRIPLVASDTLVGLGGRTVRVTGRTVGPGVVPDTVTPTGASTPAANPAGAKTILVIPITLAGQRQERSVADLNATLFGTGPTTLDPMGTLSDWVRSASSGVASASGVVTPWMSNTRFGPASCGATFDLEQEARNAAIRAGYDPGAYSHVVIYFPRTESCWWHGMGAVGGSTIWLNGFNTPDGFPGVLVVAHEMGHNYGLQHARAAMCGGTTFGSSGTLSDCALVEYGDRFATMGNNVDGVHTYHNLSHARSLGWGSFATADISTPGSYRLAPLYGGDPGSAPRGLTLARPNGSTFWLESRVAVAPFESWPTGSAILSGVVLHVSAGPFGSGAYTNMLDAHPKTADPVDAPLLVGESITEPLTGITITVVARDASGRVTVATSYGTSPSPGASPSPSPSGPPTPSPGAPRTSCSRGVPVVTASRQSLLIDRGVSVAIQVYVRNTDTSGCGSSTFTWTTASAGKSAITSKTGPSTQTVAPGATSSASAVITASATATGTVVITFRATRSAAPTSGAIAVSVTSR